MQLVTSEIRDGKHRSETVWVTHYSQPDLNKKALRNVPPTQCLICSIEDTDKRVYYSENYFAPLNKKGEITKKVISPVDNTGYRTHPGNELFVFTTEEEANKKWNEQLAEIVIQLHTLAESAKRSLLADALRLTNMLKGT